MAFLESLGSKVSEAGNKIAETARNNSQISQLQNAVAQYQLQMDDAFKMLGSLTYNKIKDPESPEPDYQQYVAEIDRLNEQMNQAINNLDAVRGVTRCPNCGAEVPFGSTFCGHCGIKIVQPADRQNIAAIQHLCPGCGREYEEGSRFCLYCGHRLTDG